MKRIFLWTALVLFGHTTFAQTEITPQMLKEINATIDKEIPTFKQSLSTKYLSDDEMAFALDTFRIERIVSERMNIDGSTIGMNETINDRTDAYDKLMNKYYNKLMKLLQGDDKKVLTTAQKAWLVFRDAEARLISTMTYEEYSGGGTMQSNIATSAYSDLVVKRTIDIFNYYNNILKK